jgi:Fur family ferric uptake transcriptional regulator
MLYYQMRMKINRNAITKVQPVTPQRKLLFSVMQEAGKHLDAKELYRRASERDASISLATVYRNLRVFKEQGLIDERHLGKTCCYYEMKHLGEHQHLVCQGCGQVTEFESPLILKLVAEVQRKNNFSVTKVDLYLEGYCHKCKEEKR